MGISESQNEFDVTFSEVFANIRYQYKYYSSL